MATSAKNEAMKRMPRPKREMRPSRAAAMAGVPPAMFPAAPAQSALPAPNVLTKPKQLAPLVSTKPSDSPMAMAKMKMTKSTAGGVKPIAIMPKMAPKPAGKTQGKRVSRPKTGLK